MEFSCGVDASDLREVSTVSGSLMLSQSYETYQFDILKFILRCRSHVFCTSNMRHVAPIIRAIFSVWRSRGVVDEAVDTVAVQSHR